MSFRVSVSSMRAIAAGAAAVLGVALTITPAAAQTQGQGGAQGNAQVGQTYGSWTGACEQMPGGGNECFIFQNVKDAQSGRPMMSLKVGYFGPNNEAAILADLPTGVLIPPGAAFAVDGGNEVRVPYQICTPGLCRAIVPLNDQMISRMKAGSALQVSFVTAAGKKLGENASLSGFTAGFDSVKK